MKSIMFMVFMMLIAVYQGFGEDTVIVAQPEAQAQEVAAENGDSLMVKITDAAEETEETEAVETTKKTEARPHPPGLKASVGVDLNFIDGFGGSFDFLVNNHVGIGLGGYGMWNQSAYGFRGTLRYLLNIKKSPVQVYPFAGAGYCIYNLDTLIEERPLRQTLQMAEFFAGAGAHYAFGHHKRHTVLFELGYRYAQKDYFYNAHTLIGQNSYQRAVGKVELRPLYMIVGYRIIFFSRG